MTPTGAHVVGWPSDGCCLVQPRADPSSAVASTYDSVLSVLVSSNPLIAAAGEDNQEEKERKVQGHQH